MIKSCTFFGIDINDFSFGLDYTSPSCIKLKLMLSQLIHEQYVEGIKSFFIGCEQGVDLWAGEIITAMMSRDPEIELNCIIPFEEQHAKWCLDNQELYFKVLGDCTKVKILHPHYTDTCVEECQRALVDLSSTLIVVADHDRQYPMVEYAKKLNRNIIYLE